MSSYYSTVCYLLTFQQVAYIGWIVLALYVNFNAGVGKPLWEITVGEFSVWFKVSPNSQPPSKPTS